MIWQVKKIRIRGTACALWSLVPECQPPHHWIPPFLLPLPLICAQLMGQLCLRHSRWLSFEILWLAAFTCYNINLSPFSGFGIGNYGLGMHDSVARNSTNFGRTQAKTTICCTHIKNLKNHGGLSIRTMPWFFFDSTMLSRRTIYAPGCSLITMLT